MTLQLNSQYFIHQIIVHFTPPITPQGFSFNNQVPSQNNKSSQVTINHRVLNCPPIDGSVIFNLLITCPEMRWELGLVRTIKYIL